MIIAESKPESQPRARTRKLQSPRKQPNLAINPDAIYSRRESAQATRNSESTMVRAFLNGHLEALRVGNRIRHTGAQLLAWLNAGGRTA